MEHDVVPLGERHAPHNFEYADETARLAATITDSKWVNALALQLDDGSYWRVASVSPTTWEPGSTPAWDDLTGKPSTFPPSTHSHAISDVTDLQDELDAKEPTITKATGYAKWNGSAWVFVNETYMQTSHAANGIAGGDIANWNTAFGWGDHSSAGYQASLGYTPENAANKSTNATTDAASNTKYPSVKAIVDYAVAADASVLSSAATDATTKANAAQAAAIAASTPVAHIGSGGAAHANVVASGAAGFMSGADKTKLDAITGANSGDETGARIAALHHAAASKATPVDADLLPLIDSAASNALKNLSWSNLKVGVQSGLQFLQSGTGAVARGNQNKLRERVSVKDFGVVGDGVVDDTAAIQICATAGGAYYIPFGSVIRLTAPITIVKPVTFYGDGCVAFSDLDETAANVRGDGAWFFINHTGVGFSIDGTSGTSDGVALHRFKGCGTFRTQPTPGAGAFTPTAHDWDFNVTDVEIELDDFVALNPTKFFTGLFSRGGRLRMNNVRGQPLQYGISIDQCYDVCPIDVHFWPYWSLNTNVQAYTLANLFALQTGRVDGLMLKKFFTIYHYIGWNLVDNGYGVANRAHGDWVYLDNGARGIVINAGCNGATINISELTVYGRAATTSYGYTANGNSNKLTVGFADFDTFKDQAIYLSGTGNEVQISIPKFANYSFGTAGFGIVISAGNTVTFDGFLTNTQVSGGTLVLNSGTLNTVNHLISSAGGTVTQLTSKSTGVTLNKQMGAITMNNAALAAGATASFLLSNSLIAANDLLHVELRYTGRAGGTYQVFTDALSAGSCSVTLLNRSAGSLSDGVVVAFSIIKGST